MKHQVYLGAPSEVWALANELGQRLEHGGDIRVVSTWHTSEKIKYPENASTRGGALAQNISEMHRATVGLFLMHVGTPRTTIAELGYMLACGFPVVQTQSELPQQRTLFDAHGSVLVVPARNLDAVDLAKQLEAALRFVGTSFGQRPSPLRVAETRR